MSKLRVLVTVLSSIERTGWVNPFLAQNLITMSHDMRYHVAVEMVVDKFPVDYARNVCISMARERKSEFLLMIDCDQSFESNPLDILSDGLEKDIISLPCMQGYSPSAEHPFIPNFRVLDHPEVDGAFCTVKKAGTGSMFISHRVWEGMRGPWFRWTYLESSELHESVPNAGEDFDFCERARSAGFKVWVHSRAISHWKTSEVTRLGMYTKASQDIARIAGQAGIAMPNAVNWIVREKVAAEGAGR